jgi:hypothetical protein
MNPAEAYVAGWWDGWEACRDYLFMGEDMREPDPEAVDGLSGDAR